MKNFIKRLCVILGHAFLLPIYCMLQMNASSPLLASDYDLEYKDLDVEEKVYELCKDASPFSVILNKISKETTDQDTVYWYEKEPGSRWTQSRGGNANSATTLAVDDASEFVEGNTVAVMSASGSVLETMRVTGRDLTAGSNTITIAGRALTGSAQTISDDQWLLNLGDTSPENSLAPKSNNRLPVQKFNYVEEKRTIYDGSTLSQMGLKPGESSRKQLANYKLIEHEQDLENTIIAGQRFIDADTTRRYMGGLLYFMQTNQYNAGGILTESAFDTGFCEKLFKYDKRPALLVCGTRILSAICGWGKGKLFMSEPKDTYGMTLQWYQSPHGKILLVPSLAMDNVWSGMGLGLHMQNIKLVSFNGAKARLERNIQEPDRHGFKDGYYSVVTFKYMLDKTHALLTGVTG
jgi:hypothetical protein